MTLQVTFPDLKSSQIILLKTPLTQTHKIQHSAFQFVSNQRLFSILLRFKGSGNQLVLIFYNCLSDAYKAFSSFVEEHCVKEGNRKHLSGLLLNIW